MLRRRGLLYALVGALILATVAAPSANAARARTSCRAECIYNPPTNCWDGDMEIVESLIW